jgi:UrcA family protein
MKLACIFASAAAALVLLTAAPQTGFTAQAAAAATPPPPPPPTEELIIRAPDVVRRPLPRQPGPGAQSPGLRNPEIISLTRAVSYADLDLGRPADVQELQRRIGTTARDICAELQRRFPRQNPEFVYSATDCVKKATDDGMETVRQLTAR